MYLDSVYCFVGLWNNITENKANASVTTNVLDVKNS